MKLSIQFVKQHWAVIVAAVVGLFVLYYLVKSMQGSPSAATSTPDLSGGSAAVTNLSAAASLTNAQLNAQVETASYQANVADNGIAAQLQASLADTAGKVAVAQGQTAAQLALGLDTNRSTVDVQSIISKAQVQTTAIQGHTLEDLAVTSSTTQLGIAALQAQTIQAQIAAVSKQVANVQNFSKHAANDYGALAPIIALETGQGGAAVGTAQAYEEHATATGTGATVAGVGAGIGSAAGGISKLLTGLFA